MQKHAVDFVYAALIFDGYTLTRLDDRKIYGEERRIFVGLGDDECFVVVYIERKDRISLISAWKGGRDERAEYQASLARGHPEDEGAG
ncbi:BrnT family toxin [Xanthobacter tagetidis]|uniref:BrnT family toxin n=1 Tax=Xanthobacter tagetidis TaxID=60216 RepID=A0A3L7AQY6_9HYPH|nr:BrnT family toxin [Xanthobacter tagetidis]